MKYKTDVPVSTLLISIWLVSVACTYQEGDGGAAGDSTATELSSNPDMVSIRDVSPLDTTARTVAHEAMDYDEQAMALELTSLTFWSSPDQAYTTVDATADGPAGSCWPNGPNYNRWFRFQATTNYIDVVVRVGDGEGDITYPLMALWDDAGGELACATFAGADVDVHVEYDNLIPGQWYYASVDNYEGPHRRGSFSLFVNDQQLADYDFRATAVELTDLDHWRSPDRAYSTLGGTGDENRGSCWNSGPNNNRWFRFQATGNYVDVELLTGGSEGSLRYPFLALWDASGNELGCRKFADAYSDLDLQNIQLTPGDWYYISVDNYGQERFMGSFSLSINTNETLSYDHRDHALELTDLDNWSSANQEFTTYRATPDQSRGSCWNNGPSFNRWFRFQASTNFIDVRLRTGGEEGSLRVPFLALWDQSGNEIACSRFTSEYSDLDIQRLDLVPGQWYYISVDNHQDHWYRGTFSLSVSDQVPMDYDYRQYAEELTDLAEWSSAPGAYSTVAATADESKGSCWNNGPNYNRWFRFQAVTTDVTIELDTGGSAGTVQHPFMALWDDMGNEVACAAFTDEEPDLLIESTTLTPGNWYYLSVDNFFGTVYRGSFSLRIHNYNYDYRDYAIVLDDFDDWISSADVFTTENGTPDETRASCWYNGPNYNRWFRFQPNTNFMNISVLTGAAEGTLQYPYIALWDSSGNELSCKRTNQPDTDLDIQINDLVPGDWYYVSVDNFAGEQYQGTFSLFMSELEGADYDYPAEAIELSNLSNWTSTDGAYSTLEATSDGSRPSCWNSGPNYNRWFRFQAVTDYIDVQMHTGDSAGTVRYPLLALFDANFNEVGCARFTQTYSDPQIINNSLIPGEWYYIAADNFVGTAYQGSFALSINDQEPMDYDDRAYALEITDLNSWSSGDAAFSTIAATPDENKGSCWNNGPNYNRWFRFQAVTSSIDVTMHTGGAAGTVRYPFMALWDDTGNELGCARFTAEHSDLNIQRNDLVPGAWYYISVDNFNYVLYPGTFGLSVNGL